MLDTIIIIVNFILFILSFIFVAVDVVTYNKSQMEDAGKGKIPKLSRYSLLFSLLTMLSLILV